VDGGDRNATAANARDSEANGEAAIEVKGSYSTKVRNATSYQSRNSSEGV
jgi:hypothetical protein